MPRARTYPKSLGRRGGALWRDTLAVRPRLGPGERILLEEACRLTDRLELLHRLIDDPGAHVVNLSDDASQYTVLVDDAMREARMATVTLSGVMKQLGLDKMQAEPKAPPAPAPAPASSAPPSPPPPADPLDQIAARRRERSRRDGTNG